MTIDSFDVGICAHHYHDPKIGFGNGFAVEVLLLPKEMTSSSKPTAVPGARPYNLTIASLPAVQNPLTAAKLPTFRYSGSGRRSKEDDLQPAAHHVTELLGRIPWKSCFCPFRDPETFSSEHSGCYET